MVDGTTSNARERSMSEKLSDVRDRSMLQLATPKRDLGGSSVE